MTVVKQYVGGVWTEVAIGAQGNSGPQGATGAQGSQGPQGPQGLTGPQGTQGSTGSQGSQGPQGPTGPQGAGVVTGGTTGQFLVKNSGTNYDTTWLTTPLPIANGGTNSTATATSGGVGYGTGTAHAYTAAGTSGQVLQSAGTGTPIWATYARGFVAQTTSNAGSSAATTTFVDTALLFNSQAVTSGRKYKWTVVGHVYGDTASAVIQVALRDSGGTVLQAIDILNSGTTVATAYSFVYYETINASTVTRKISIKRNGGTGNVYHFGQPVSGDGRLATFTLEDVGI